MLGWAVYLIYSWSTWTGLWPTVAKWTSHIEYVGSADEVYDEGFTLVMCMGIVEILLGGSILGVVLLEWSRTARKREQPPETAPPS